MAIDPTTSNFIINMTGIGVASLIGLIGAFSKCMMKSRCTNIKSPCLSCDRDVMSADSDVYKDAEESFTPLPIKK